MSNKIGTVDMKLVADRLHCVDALMSDTVFADKVLKGGKVVNVISEEIYEADVAISGEFILMVVSCRYATVPARTGYQWRALFTCHLMPLGAPFREDRYPAPRAYAPRVRRPSGSLVGLRPTQ